MERESSTVKELDTCIQPPIEEVKIDDHDELVTGVMSNNF